VAQARTWPRAINWLGTSSTITVIVSFCEKVLAILKCFRGKLVFLVKSISEETERRRIACKHVWCQAGKRPDPGYCHRDLPGVPAGQKIVFRTS